ncbi:MAG: RdgB/HAM1 family non-canonical purine NTP pyrophosphatase [Candidatus Omnitrophota bacterium]
MNFEIVVATRNRKKLAEIKDILKEFKPIISSLADYAKPPWIIENGKTFRENAIKKALAVARSTGKFTLGEDSGLCVYSLGGKPGVYSSRFSGRNKSDRQNNLKLLKALLGLPQSKRKAYYVCAVALADKDGLVGAVEGRCLGVIGVEEKGTHGFGYDPLFIIPKYKKTFAQLGEKIKHKMSHRYHALKKAKKIIQKYIERHRTS